MTLLSMTLYLVATNMMLLAAGWRSLPSQSAGFSDQLFCNYPLSLHYIQSMSLAGATLLGTSSLSTLGVVGVVIEVAFTGLELSQPLLFQVVVIAYLFVTSIVGLYSIPQFHRILPKTRCTSSIAAWSLV